MPKRLIGRVYYIGFNVLNRLKVNNIKVAPPPFICMWPYKYMWKKFRHPLSRFTLSQRTVMCDGALMNS